VLRPPYAEARATPVHASSLVTSSFELRPHRVAWAIHAFTSTGIMAGFFALLSVLDGSPRAALIWMLVAMVIDGLDGPIARRFEVGTTLPHVDGNALDLMIDYVTCVVTPALFLYEFRLIPHRYNVGLICVFLILTSSLYVMSNKKIMTTDNYFNGFPAMWNVVANILFVLQSREWVNVVVIGMLVVLSFVPVKFAHVIRVRDFRAVTLPVVVVWLTAMLYVTWILDEETKNCSQSCLPVGAEIAQMVVYLGTAWIVGVGVWRTLRGARPQT